LALFNEAAELLIEDDPVLSTDVGFETALIQILLEDEELARVVAFPVDGELSITGLTAHLLGQARDDRPNLRFRAGLSGELGVQKHGHARLLSRSTVPDHARRQRLPTGVQVPLDCAHESLC